MERYDIAIVGGGPVGLVAAIEARLAGQSAVVIEQRDGTIDKACGEGLMPGALPVLKRLGVDPLGMPIMGITYRQGAQSVSHRFEGTPGRGVRRTTLHDALSQRADELGVVRMTAKVEHLEQTADEVHVAGITARYLLACDGLHSSVAKMVGLARPAPRRARRYGIRQHYAIEPWGDTVEIHYGRHAEIYVTPIAENEVGIALLGARHTDFDAAIADIPDLATRLAGATVTSLRRGAGPFRQRTRARTKGRILLVGDASGYVDAITGEGLRLGFAQASAAVNCILAGDVRRYETEWTRITRDFRVTTTALVRFATSPLRRGIVPLSAALPGRFGAVVESLAR
ncbi:MAG TPA: NAD(P)/FAD-dependent oxidoreductase [Galbitalea sp.]|nr:NAD(P)/FAD-dependent oxidoreductase [Galbitalea sp.]